MPHTPLQHQHVLATPFLGLAPFLRLSIAGTDLRAIGQTMLNEAQERPDDANLWMNLSIVMQSLGQREIGLAIQDQALALQRVYHLAATRRPSRFRLLVLMAPGDLAANTPLECLLEDSDITLDLYYLSADQPFAAPIPEHDAILVALGETDENRPLLEALETILSNWPRPVINAPQHIRSTEREMASALLQDIPGLLMPATRQISRAVLQALANGEASADRNVPDIRFPIIVRPVGSHAGRDLERIEQATEMAAYLAKTGADDFFIAPFIDYSSPDGLFRKFRVALINGQAYACHMAASSHWMIHYVNAGMYEDAAKRAEEGRFMANFDAFAQRHAAALAAIQARSKLEYLCIDCAETQDGQLLIFEIDHAMVVHAMDPEDLFPYKQSHMLKVKDGFRSFLFSLSTTPDATCV